MAARGGESPLRSGPEEFSYDSEEPLKNVSINQEMMKFLGELHNNLLKTLLFTMYIFFVCIKIMKKISLCYLVGPKTDRVAFVN